MTVFQVPVYSECEAAIPRSGRTWVRGQEGRWQQKLPITGLCTRLCVLSMIRKFSRGVPALKELMTLRTDAFTSYVTIVIALWGVR